MVASESEVGTLADRLQTVLRSAAEACERLADCEHTLCVFLGCRRGDGSDTWDAISRAVRDGVGNGVDLAKMVSQWHKLFAFVSQWDAKHRVSCEAFQKFIDSDDFKAKSKEVDKSMVRICRQLSEEQVTYVLRNCDRFAIDRTRREP